MPGVPKAKRGKKQQVEKNQPAASLQMHKTSGIRCFKSHDRTHLQLTKKCAFLSYSNLDLPDDVSESKGRQQVLLICWCYGFRSVPNAHLDQG